MSEEGAFEYLFSAQAAERPLAIDALRGTAAGALFEKLAPYVGDVATRRAALDGESARTLASLRWALDDLRTPTLHALHQWARLNLLK